MCYLWIIFSAKIFNYYFQFKGYLKQNNKLFIKTDSRINLIRFMWWQSNRFIYYYRIHRWSNTQSIVRDNNRTGRWNRTIAYNLPVSQHHDFESYVLRVILFCTRDNHLKIINKRIYLNKMIYEDNVRIFLFLFCYALNLAVMMSSEKYN